MRASRLVFWTGAALGLFALFAACSSSTDVEPGTGGNGTGNAAAGGSTQSGGGGSGATGGGGSCAEGSEQCVGGVHEVCTNGSFEADPCPGGQGCDDASGTCVACLCTPGPTGNCASATSLEVCEPSCLGLSEQACNASEACVGGTCLAVVCTPGTAHCPDADTSEICNASGTGYEPGATCGPKETCTETVGCETLCAAYARAPSSVGCSFFALNMDNFDEAHADAIVVGNTSSTLTAVVSLWGAPGGVESLIQADVQIPPLGQHTFTLPNTPADVIESVSQLRPGGSFRVESDLPVIAYQHSPLTPYYTNDASCLLPEATLGRHYFVPSYYDALNGYPSYFNVIATEDNTQVTITVPHPTAGGSGVSALAAGGSTTVTMNRYDTLQVVNGAGLTTAERDVMGAEIDATAPIAVFGAIECAQVPAGYTYCDHMEEQAVPVRNWGTTYVGAHVPRRSASERYYWRVMSQAPGTVIDTTPPQPGFPVTLDAGQFYEFYTQESFIFTGSSPFAAYQYITGQDAFGAGTGDPAMITAVPVEQFLNRYVLLTPSGYAVDYVQIVRTTGDDVLVDGVVVPANAYYAIGAYTVADYAVAAGPHVITSVSPFGIVGAGYTGATSYGYPGGMALNNIAPE